MKAEVYHSHSEFRGTDRELDKLRSILTWETESFACDWVEGSFVLVQKNNDLYKGRRGIVLNSGYSLNAEVKKHEVDVTVKLEDGNTVMVKGNQIKPLNVEKAYQDKSWGVKSYRGTPRLLSSKIPMEIVDHNEKSPRIKIPVDILPSNDKFQQLDDWQAFAVSKALTKRGGMVIVPTGGGKTNLMIAILRYILDNDWVKNSQIVVVVPKTGLSDQFVERAYSLGFSEEEIGVLHGKKKQWECKIVVSTISLLSTGMRNNNKKIMNLIKSTECIVFDEAHHMSEGQDIDFIEAARNKKFLFGCTGTAWDEDNLLGTFQDTLVFGLLDGPAFETTYEHLVSIGRIAQIHYCMVPIDGKMLKFRGRFQKIHESFVQKNHHRTEKIQQAATFVQSLGKKMLVLVGTKKHAEIIMSQVTGVRQIGVFGAGKCWVWEDDEDGESLKLVQKPISYSQFSKDFDNGEYDMVVATTVMNEGFDLPECDLIVNAAGGKEAKSLMQKVGRGARSKKKGLNNGFVLDFYDKGHVYTFSHSKKRETIYKDKIKAIGLQEYQFWDLLKKS